MCRRVMSRLCILTLLTSSCVAGPLSAQEAAVTAPSAPQAPTSAAVSAATSALASEQLVVPMGTRLPLILRNGINTRTAKRGDSVYFETAYPIASNNRIAIPIGTFLRGEILEAKRPGRISGRGEFRIAVTEMTFSNGYVVDLRASPSSVDRGESVGVNSEGKIVGPGGVGRDVATVALATAAGGPVGGYAGVLAGSPSRASLAIGHGAGAVAGLAIILMTRGPEAELPRGTTLDVVFDRPLVLNAASLPTSIGTNTNAYQQYPPAQLAIRRPPKEIHRRSVVAPMFPLLFLLH